MVKPSTFPRVSDDSSFKISDKLTLKTYWFHTFSNSFHNRLRTYVSFVLTGILYTTDLIKITG